MTTSTEAVDRLAARSARARYAADAYREARRSELALMAEFVGKPRPRPQPRQTLTRKPRRPGRWLKAQARPGESARLVWVPASMTASAARARLSADCECDASGHCRTVTSITTF
jgi:hypothetical protein